MPRCTVCKATKKGWTYFQFYSDGVVKRRRTGEGDVTLRDGKAVCLVCAAVDVEENFRGHNWTWEDGSVSAWKSRPNQPLHQYDCECGAVACFRFTAQAKASGWVGSTCKDCGTRKRMRELEEENEELKRRLAKIQKLTKY